MFCLFFVIALFAGCEKQYVSMNDAGVVVKKKVQPSNKDTTTKPGGGKDTTSTPLVTVLFKRDILPVFRNNCLGCHDAGTSLQLDEDNAYTTLTDGKYTSTTDPENSKFFKNQLKGHPDDYLLPAEHDKIVTWMKEGAKNN
jgi:hypothetical protein